MIGFIYFLWNYMDECIKKRKLKKEKLLEKIL